MFENLVKAFLFFLSLEIVLLIAMCIIWGIEVLNKKFKGK